jgi:hypothetical protein
MRDIHDDLYQPESALAAKRWLTGGRHCPYFSLQYHNRMIGNALAKLAGRFS